MKIKTTLYERLKEIQGEINKQKKKSRIELAELSLEKKIEILEQMQMDRQDLMNSKPDCK